MFEESNENLICWKKGNSSSKGAGTTKTVKAKKGVKVEWIDLSELEGKIVSSAVSKVWKETLSALTGKKRNASAGSTVKKGDKVDPRQKSVLDFFKK